MPPSAGVASRLRGVPDLQGRYLLLDDDEVRETMQAIRLAYPYEQVHVGNVIAQPRGTAVMVDIYPLEPDRVRALLLGLGVSEQTLARVVWLWDRTGALMQFGDFVQHYDDLWEPSGDDVLLTNERYNWLLHIDHEEVLMFAHRGVSR